MLASLPMTIVEVANIRKMVCGCAIRLIERLYLWEIGTDVHKLGVQLGRASLATLSALQWALLPAVDAYQPGKKFRQR
jgi:hypothetical protein